MESLTRSWRLVRPTRAKNVRFRHKPFEPELKQVYSTEATESSKFVLDIIVIHDLVEDCEEAWINEDSGKRWSEIFQEKLGFDVRILVFEYGGNEISSINDMLSMKSLELHAENLLQAISSDRNNRKEESYRPIAFLAHGYGGLICEQALVTALEEDGTIGRRGLNQTHGIILLGTPHFRAGLAEWAILSARSTGVPCAKTSQRQDWSSLKDDLDKISNMQSAIDDLVQRERGRHSSQRINFRACHSYRPIPKHNLSLSNEWAMLPYATSTGIDTDHFGMINFDIIEKLLPDWLKSLPISTKGWPESNRNKPGEAIERSIPSLNDEVESAQLEAIEELVCQLELGLEALKRLIPFSKDEVESAQLEAFEEPVCKLELELEALKRLIPFSKDKDELL